MMPNMTSMIQIKQGNLPQGSMKLMPNTAINKQDNSTMAVKKINNFSYALSDEIGIGLTSRVYKGKNDINGLPVAIKCIELKNQQDSLSQQFIKQEIAILQKIKSVKANYLLKLQQVLLTSNHLYIVTEFCEGKDVAKILRQKKVLPQQQAQSIMKQMIQGYKQLYSLGLIHRDLKLSNLFVTYGRVKLADFGFAINESKCNTNFTYNAGSPKYMPPQSLRFNRYSFKSDVWAMGIMAYELVYGHAPWKDKDDHKLYDLILSVPIQKLFEPNIQVSDQYKNFVVNCLKVNTNERANPDFIFNFFWPIATDFVTGYEQQKKTQQIIKVPGKNYAVFNSANQISYQSKQLDVDDFSSTNVPFAQLILLSQLNVCRFLMNIFKSLRAINSQNNYLITSLCEQVTLTVQIIMKLLGQITCFQKNKLDIPNFDAYTKTGEWQNMKQLIVRYDIEFRGELKSNKLPPKGATIPQTSILPQAISFLKQRFPENAKLIDNLITYYEIRTLFATGLPLNFAQKVNMGEIVKQSSLPDSQFMNDNFYNRVSQRLNMAGL